MTLRGHFWAHVPSAKTPGAWKDSGFASRAFLKRQRRGAELGGWGKGEEEGRFEQVLCRLGWQACQTEMSGETGRGGGCRGQLSRAPRKEAAHPPREGLGVRLQAPRSQGVWASGSTSLPRGKPEAPSHLDPPPRTPPALASASSLLSCLNPSSPAAPGVHPRPPMDSAQASPPIARWSSLLSPPARVPPSRSPPSGPLLGSGLTVLLRGRRREGRGP